MPHERVLITVKTYPTLSRTYTELVCTAGIREDGTWIRIYPSPFRFLEPDQRYRKYQWVELDLERNPSDPRPESYRPRNIDDIRTGEFIDTGRDWAERRRLVLDSNPIHTVLNDVIQGAKANVFSLATFKPTEILDFVAEDVEEDWDINRQRIAEQNIAQGSLFDDSDATDFRLMPKLPVKFSYRFRDEVGRESTLMIEDWEIGQLYWNCLKGTDRPTAIGKVREKYLDEFATKHDLHLFLGTTRRWHGVAANPYVIIGVFYPPLVRQLALL